MLDSFKNILHGFTQHFDLFVIMFVVALGIRGFLKGITKDIFAIGGMVAGVILGRTLGPHAGALLIKNDPTHAVAAAAGFCLIFFIVSIGAAIAGFAVRKIVRITGFGVADRILGAVLGVALGFIVPGFILSLALSLEKAVGGSTVVKSLLAPTTLKMIKVIAGLHLPL